MHEGLWTNQSTQTQPKRTYHTNGYTFGPVNFLLCPVRCITGPVDPTRMKPIPHKPSEGWRVGSGRVGSGRVRSGAFQISRVGSSRVNSFSVLAGRVGSGQGVSKSRGSGRVGSRHVEHFAGRVWSGGTTRPGATHEV